jgi:hypothetical protein
MAFIPLEPVVTSIPLAMGPDTKVDPRALQAPKLTVLENGWFEEPGGIQKRGGQAALSLTKVAGGSITASRMRAVCTRGDELLLFAENRAYSWSEKNSGWLDRGRFDSVLAEQETIAADRTEQVLGDRAETASVVVYAWQVNKAGGSFEVRYQCIDKATGATQTSSSSAVVASAVRPRCLAVNGSLLVFYFDGTSELKVDVITPSSIYSTIGSPITLSSADCAGWYDVDSHDATHAVVAYRTTGNQVKIMLVDNAGSASSTRTIARACHTWLAVNYHATVSRVSLVRVDQTGGANDTIRHDWLLANLTDDSAVNTSVNVETLNRVLHVGTVVLTGQTAYTFWTLDGAASPGGSSPAFDQVRRGTVTSGGTVVVRVLVRRSSMGSRPRLWKDGTAERILIHVIHDDGDQQPCYVLLDGTYVVGDTNGAIAAGDEAGLVARLLPGEGRGRLNATINGHLPQIEDIGNDQYAAVLGFRRRLEALGGNVYSERGMRDFVYTCYDSRAFQGREEGRCLYLPGGYQAEYDGVRVVESGFWLYPPAGASGTGGMSFATADTGGQLPNTKLYYRLIWEWRNAGDERVISTWAGDIEVDLSGLAGTDNKVTFTVPTLPYTNKSNVVLAVYRSHSTATAGPFYRVSPVDPTATGWVTNNIDADTVTFADDNGLDGGSGITETELLTKEEFPLAERELDPMPPAPPFFMAGGQARLVTRDPQDTNVLRYSKLRSAGDEAMFSDITSLQVPQDGGALIQADVTENALIALKERAIYVAQGNGPDNVLGPEDVNPAGYGAPQKVSEIGCIDPRSVVRAPPGVFFQSKKGIYLLTNNYQTVYVGAAVQDYVETYTPVRGAVHLADKHQVRFYFNGGTAAYDYLIDQWAWWPGRDGLSACLWQSQPLWLDGDAPYEPQDTFVDGAAAYSMVVETAWIKLTGLIGLKRVWWLYVLGEWRSLHQLRVRVAYDYDPNWVDNYVHVPPNGVAGTPLKFRVGLQRQLCTALKVRIEDEQLESNPLRESYKLTALALEWGRERGGGPKYSTSETVGDPSGIVPF